MAPQAKKNATRRGKNLTDDAIEQIVRLLDAWSSKLTWDALVDAIVVRLHSRYTRQALYNHQRIRAAYELRKKALRGQADGTNRRKALSPNEVAARIDRLEAENQRLELENQRLLEQFAVWAYNAHLRGLSKDFLSQPLPLVQRDRTASPRRPAKVTKKP